MEESLKNARERVVEKTEMIEMVKENNELKMREMKDTLSALKDAARSWEKSEEEHKRQVDDLVEQLHKHRTEDELRQKELKSMREFNEKLDAELKKLRSAHGITRALSL